MNITNIPFTLPSHNPVLRWDDQRCAYERIQEMVEQIALHETDAKLSSCKKDFCALGVDQKDHHQVFRLLKSLQKSQEQGRLFFEFCNHTPGTYFVKKQGQEIPLAVFKLGEKRGAYEIAVRKLSLSLGFSECVPTAIFCTVHNLPTHLRALEAELKEESDEEQETEQKEADFFVKELWNGMGAEYHNNPFPGQLAAVGILQPYQKPSSFSSYDAEQLSRLLVLLVAANVGGVKKEGIINYCSVSNARSFSPVQNRQDFPFLQGLPQEQLDRPLSSAIIQALQVSVQTWDIPAILKTMKKEPLYFFDRLIESIPGAGIITLDEGKHLVGTKTKKQNPLSTSPLDYLDNEINPNMRILIRSQIKALEHRLTTLQQFVLTTSSFSLSDLVRSIDSQNNQQQESSSAPLAPGKGEALSTHRSNPEIQA